MKSWEWVDKMWEFITLYQALHNFLSALHRYTARFNNSPGGIFWILTLFVGFMYIRLATKGGGFDKIFKLKTESSSSEIRRQRYKYHLLLSQKLLSKVSNYSSENVVCQESHGYFGFKGGVDNIFWHRSLCRVHNLPWEFNIITAKVNIRVQKKKYMLPIQTGTQSYTIRL